MMSKRCPIHGETEAMVERDPLFYQYALGLGAKSIYGGHFVDITKTCQLRCNPCYMKLEKKDPAGIYSIDAITNECLVNINRAPYILTGGEPTLHPQIMEVVEKVSEIGRVEMLSNGIKLADREFFNDLMPALTDKDGITHLHLSLHINESDAWKEVIEMARADKMKIASALIVVKDKAELLKAMVLCNSIKDVVRTFRIKAATNIWNTGTVTQRIFISDMLDWLEATRNPLSHVGLGNNKPCFHNVLYGGMHLMLVSWYDVTNVDLLEIECPPTYRANNGEVCNFVTTGLINEGLEKGWCKGIKLDSKST